MDRPRSVRWWRRLPARSSVRGLMILVLLLGCGLGWIVRPAHIQRDAVAAIERAGGSVHYDWQVKPTPGPLGTSFNINPNARTRVPKWLVNWLGVDFFGDVIHVSAGPRDIDAVMAHIAALRRVEFLSLYAAADDPLTDAGMVHLRGLTELRFLSLSPRARVTRVGLENLTGMRRLEHLVLFEIPLTDDDLVPVGRLTSLKNLHSYSPRITDVGASHLSGLVNLRMLDLANTQITGAGLTHLRGMTQLETLDLRGTGVETLGALGRHLPLEALILTKTPLDDVGLSTISGLSGRRWLRVLFVGDTRITDAGMIHLRGLTGLTTLVIKGTRVTDSGLDHISSLPRLQSLVLSETGVTDAGLARLAGLPALKGVRLDKTWVTDSGVFAFSGAHPRVQIDRTGPK